MNESKYTTYQSLINELTDLADSIQECVSLVQIGSVSHPGLSDLDVIFLYDTHTVDGKSLEKSLKKIRNKYPNIPLDVWHIPFDHFEMYTHIFYVSNVSLLWGQETKKIIETPNDSERIMLFLLQTPVKVLRVSELLSYPESNSRVVLLLLSSLRHSMELSLKSFARETEKIITYNMLIEDLRDEYLTSKINIKAYNHAFNLFSEIWNDLMLDLSGFINKNFPRIKSVPVKDVYHPVSASGICHFKSQGDFAITSKFRPDFPDRFLSGWFGETLFGTSVAELPMEALFFLTNFKNRSESLGRNMFFYNDTIYKEYSEMKNVICDQAEFADKIYTFYKKNCFSKGFPLAHYYDVGISKKIKKIMGKYKTILMY